MTPEALAVKAKINKCNYIKLKCLSAAKDSKERERQSTKQEKIFANHVSDRVQQPTYIRNAYDSMAKTQTTWLKMGKRPEQTFLRRIHANGQQVHEKMLNITNHQENANKTTMRYHLTSVNLGIIKKLKKYW